jgi:hypothetical protein
VCDCSMRIRKGGDWMFEQAYENFIQSHIRSRTGERLRRLEKGHQYAEKLLLLNVWYPAFGNFDKLHPEYEVRDFRHGVRYLDCAYVHEGFRISLEADGYSPHSRNISRDEFSDERDRQNDLIIDGWKVIRFSVDRLKHQPRECQRRLQQLMGKCLGEWEILKGLGIEERELVRRALQLGGIITTFEAQISLDVSDRTARKWLQRLVKKKIMLPHSGTQRIHSYRLMSDQHGLLLD